MQTEEFFNLGNEAKGSLQCQSHPPGRILMVDDDLCRAELNAEVLGRHGYETDVAICGEAGWEKLETNRYNLLITEHTLPGLTGVGLVRRIHSASMPLPVIFAIGTMPSWPSADYPWLLKAAKLFKPYSLEALVGLVKSILPVLAAGRPKIALVPARQNQTAC